MLRRALVILAVAALLTGAVVALGTLTRSEKDEDGAAAPYRTVPLAEFDAASASVVRGPFCPDIDPRLVQATLGAAADSTRSWDNGDPVAVGPRREDVGHEYGCEYVAADGSTARAWVFAPPVDQKLARRLAERLAPTTSGPAWCTGSTPAEFGDPSAHSSCLGDGGQADAYAGLFGDAWLHCELLVPQDGTGVEPLEVADRAGRWCVGVAEAASGPAR